MITLRDFQERAQNGPIIKEKDFDLRFSRNVRQLAKDYEIIFDPEHVIPDDRTANAIYQAAVALLAENGIFHLETSRLIELSRDEIREIAGTRDKEVAFGSGKDRIVFKNRKPEDTFAPVTILGPGGCPITDDLYIPIMQSFAQEETAQGIISGSLMSAGGVQNSLGIPAEAMVLVAEATWLREVARRVGRPDMYIGIPMSGISPAAMFTAFFPGGYTRENAMMPMHLCPELKMNWDRLFLANYAAQHGIVPWISYVPVIGGYCRGPEEVAITWVAALLGELCYGHGYTATGAPRWVKGGKSTTRGALWAYAATGLALENNLSVAWGGDAIGQSAGPCTEMILHEIAAVSLVFVATGAEWIWGPLGRCGAAINHCSGMEGRMMGETVRAAAGMPRDEANELIKALLNKFEDAVVNDTAPPGKPFNECYDLRTLTPTREYLDIYAKVKQELQDMGIRYRY